MKKQTNACSSGRSLLPPQLSGHIFQKILFSSLALLLSIGLHAQTKIRVSGTVKDDKGAPAANASVVLKGTSTGVTTDNTGAFSLDVPNQKSVIVVSNTGFQTQELVVGSNTNFNVQ